MTAYNVLMSWVSGVCGSRIAKMGWLLGTVPRSEDLSGFPRLFSGQATQPHKPRIPRCGPQSRASQ